MFANIKGWKTIIWARALVVIGALLTLLNALTGDQVSIFLPDKYKPFAPLVISAIGIITEGLRWVTTGPVGDKS